MKKRLKQWAAGRNYNFKKYPQKKEKQSDNNSISSIKSKPDARCVQNGDGSCAGDARGETVRDEITRTSDGGDDQGL